MDLLPEAPESPRMAEQGGLANRPQTSAFHIPSGDRIPFSNASYSKVQHIPNRGQGSNAGEVWVRVGVGGFPT